MIHYCQNSEILSAVLSLTVSAVIYLSTHLLLHKSKNSAKIIGTKGIVLHVIITIQTLTKLEITTLQLSEKFSMIEKM